MKTRIAEFKARLSYYLKAVRSGKEVTVMERDTPIARVLPYHEDRKTLPIHPALHIPKGIASLKIPPLKGVDSLAALGKVRADDLEEL